MGCYQVIWKQDTNLPGGTGRRRSLHSTYQDRGRENLSCSIIHSYIVSQAHFLLTYCQLSLWQLPALWTQPFSRWLVLKPHASPMEPLILAVVVVAADHISEGNFLTETIQCRVLALLEILLALAVRSPITSAVTLRPSERRRSRRSRTILAISDRSVCAGRAVPTSTRKLTSTITTLDLATRTTRTFACAGAVGRNRLAIIWRSDFLGVCRTRRLSRAGPRRTGRWTWGGGFGSSWACWWLKMATFVGQCNLVGSAPFVGRLGTAFADGSGSADGTLRTTCPSAGSGMRHASLRCVGDVWSAAY